MNQFYLITVILIITFEIEIIFGVCNNYYQASGPSSTKRPFDMCYHSEIDDETLIASSWRYYCIESTAEQYGNASVGGFTAFREDFDSVDCMGTATQTRIVASPPPYLIKCEKSEPQCDVLRYRQYPITNASSCQYNKTIYAEDIEVIGICDDNGADSLAMFCNNIGSGSYFWTNSYYGGTCNADKLFEAEYQFHGCQGDGETYLEIIGCDKNYGAEPENVKPFGDGSFVAGFVLLLIAILCIIAILVWYCCWFKEGFTGSLGKGGHVRATSHADDKYDNNNDDYDEPDGVEMNTNTTTMR